MDGTSGWDRWLAQHAPKLLLFARQQARCEADAQELVQDAVVEALFRAYFAEGRDIGNEAVLADCAEAAGLDRAAVTAMLFGDEGEAEIRAEDAAIREAGISGVPSFFLNGYALFSGALPAETIAEGLRRAVVFLRDKQAA